MKIEHNKALFATYASLTVAGYDLADSKNVDLQSLIANIRDTLNLSNESKEFFSAARTNDYPVNPYFPVASELASACFFLTKEGTSYENSQAYFDFLAECNNGIQTSEEHKQYLLQLPEMLADALQNPLFPSLLQTHLTLVSKIAISPETDSIIEQALSRFPSIAPPSFAPCLLQSPMIADFARYGQNLYVISASPRPQTMLHEWLHIVLAQERGLLANLLCKQDIACLYDASQLRKLGYLRGYTMHHHLHAMEECIVQGLTAHFAQSPIEAEAQISQLYNQGFYLSEKAWKCAQLLSPDQNNFQTYLTKLFLS